MFKISFRISPFQEFNYGSIVTYRDENLMEYIKETLYSRSNFFYIDYIDWTEYKCRITNGIDSIDSTPDQLIEVVSYVEKVKEDGPYNSVTMLENIVRWQDDFDNQESFYQSPESIDLFVKTVCFYMALEKLGVKVLVNHAVKSVKRTEINLKSGEKIPAEITIWAAGVKGEPVVSNLSLPLDGNRLSVYPTLAVSNYPNIWGVGDVCGAKSKDGRFLPMVAPVAMQQGRFVAEQILRREKGVELKDFKYKDKGSMATIGRHKAVVEVNKIRFSGYPAWAAWLFLHLFYLMGGRNRIGTIVDWCWNYFTFDRGNRHIMDSV